MMSQLMNKTASWPARRTALAAMLALAIAVCGAAPARADLVSPCVNDGYLAMGNVFYDTRDYLMSGTYGGMFAGYAYLKFDALPDAPVTSATLELTSIAQTPGMFPVPEDVAVTLQAREALADVAAITDSAGAIDFQTSIGEVVDAVTVSGGAVVYSLDVTDLVNQWIASGVNNGLVLTTAAGDMGFARFHASESAVASAVPVIVSVVPEPATLGLLAAGVCGLLRRRRV